MVSLRLMPRDVKFFDLLIADGENLLSAARELRQLMDAYDDVDARIGRIQFLEHSGDEIGDEISARLDDAFITPIDREDIHELARRMDDVVDRIQEIAEATQIYDVRSPTDEARRLAAILEEQAVELAASLHKLESMKGLGEHLRRIHLLENEADGLSRKAIGRLFRESSDPLIVIKWREIYGSLEESIDAAEDVSEIDPAHRAQGELTPRPSGALRDRVATRSPRCAPSEDSEAYWGLPRWQSATSGHGRPRCASRRHSRIPIRSPAAARG